MSFEVIFSPKSAKQIKAFNEKLKTRMKKAIVEIGNDPWHRGTIKVKGKHKKKKSWQLQDTLYNRQTAK